MSDRASPPGVTWQGGTWKVWRSDGTKILDESDSPEEAARETRRRINAGEAVLLEDPDGYDFGWKEDAGEWYSLDGRAPVPAVLAAEPGAVEG